MKLVIIVYSSIDHPAKSLPVTILHDVINSSLSKLPWLLDSYQNFKTQIK